MRIIDTLLQPTRIINVDESWINETSFLRKMWCPSYAPATATLRSVTPRISLIAALDTEGRVYYALTQANTDQHVMMVYLQHLISKLDAESADWREHTYVLMDGARYHTGEEIRQFLHRMQIRVIWTAPYCYTTSPIELLFGGLKFGELNPMKLSVGKKVSRIVT